MTIGPIQFDQPVMLALLALLIPVTLVLSRRSLSGIGRGSRLAAVAVRVLALSLIVAALARTSLRDEASAVSVTVINDVSRSIPSSVQPRIDSFVERAQEGSRRPDDRLGVITAARDPIIQAAPSRLVTGIERQFIGDTEATDLASAVNQAIASAPEDAAARIVLITDANETEGSLYRAAQQARAAGIPIDVLPVEFEYAEEIMVDSVQAPASARVGETLALRVVLTSTVPVAGRLMVTRDGTPIDLDPAPDELGYYTELAEGRNVIRVPLRVDSPGPKRYDAVFEPIAAIDADGSARASIGDSVRENNSGSAITFVGDKGRVLIVADDPRETVRLESALQAGEIASETVTPSRLPGSLEALASYDAIVMLNQSAYDYPEPQQEMLRRYIHDTGGGLVMIGGPDSFGAGGWIGSPLADALPVQLDPPQKRQMPMGALAIVLDSSGSMSAGIAGTSMTQMEAANEAAIAALEALSSLDRISIVAFSGVPRVIVPLTQARYKGDIARRIRSIHSGGGTNMYPGIEEAYNQIRDSPAGLKHIIVLSDGQTMGSPGTGANLVRRIAREGATLSTVAVGNSADHRLLRTLAQSGKGRYYSVTSAGGLAQLPQIFVKEAQTIRRALIWEGDPFSPVPTGVPTETLRGISGVPPISGYIVTAPREGLSLVTLRGKEEDPIAAQWQYGLGKSVAFTSDATTRWADAWSGWAGYDPFWTQHIRWAMRPGGESTLRITTSSDGERTTLVVDAFTPSGERLDFASFRARAATPDGEGVEIELRQTGPGRYEGAFDSSDPGSYVINMIYRAPGGEEGVLEGSAQAAVIRPFADEYRTLRTNMPLLRRVASITGGRVLDADPANADLWTRVGVEMPVARTPIWQALAVIGIAVFLLDVAVRRVRIDPSALARLVGRGVAREQARSTDAMSAMRAAREHASSRTSPGAGAQGEPRRASARKFEDDGSIPLDDGVVTHSPGADPGQAARPTPRPPKAAEIDPDHAADALSALRAAKRRAREDYERPDE